MKLEHHCTPMHGVKYRAGDGLWWWQYWRGVRHTWTWHGIPVWTRLRQRDEPMYKLIGLACRNT